jgi:hypothetical protein
MSNLDPCDIKFGWYGVTCLTESKYSFVKGLFLNQNNLQGTLPVTLNNLSHARALVFDHNKIYGTLPVLDSLSTLLSLHLTSNYLSGTLPQNLVISSMNMISLLMGDNSLSGSLSSSIYSSQNLAAFDLSKNKFTSSLGNEVCNIKFFDLSGNNWICPLPSCCGQNSLQKCGPTCLSNFNSSSLFLK